MNSNNSTNINDNQIDIPKRKTPIHTIICRIQTYNVIVSVWHYDICTIINNNAARLFSSIVIIGRVAVYEVVSPTAMVHRCSFLNPWVIHYLWYCIADGSTSENVINDLQGFGVLDKLQRFVKTIDLSIDSSAQLRITLVSTISLSVKQKERVNLRHLK